MKKALVAGATGLVGEELVNQLIKDTYYDEIVVLSRRKVNYGDKRVREVLIPDFDRLKNKSASIVADDVYCCLGTTIKKAGSKEAFIKIDYQYVVDLADIALSNSAKQFILISSMGANSGSSFFYNRVKGTLEQELSRKSFQSFLVLRPSLLLGDRKEFRYGEKYAQKIFPLFSPLMIGPLRKYKAIQAADVAIAMMVLAKKGLNGFHVFNSEEVKNLAEEARA